MAPNPKAALLVIAAALLVSCCYASRSPLVTGGKMAEEKAVVTVPIMSVDPSKCEWMEMCSVDKCTEHCVRIGLGNERGFCNFHNMQFQCCCPITFPPAATIPSSVKQV